MSSSSPSSSSHPNNQTEPKQAFSRTGKPLPAASLKWGRTLKPSTTTETTNPDFETYYTPEQQAKLRAKGVNPALKAEMEWSKSQSEGKGFWGKVAQTSLGGGWTK